MNSLNTGRIKRDMCTDDTILACTAQELGIHIHGSHEGLIYLAIIPITIIALMLINRKMNK